MKWVVETYCTPTFSSDRAEWQRDGYEWDSRDMAQLYAITHYRGLNCAQWRIMPPEQPEPDILIKLRQAERCERMSHWELSGEAANEIETLRARLAKLSSV